MASALGIGSGVGGDADAVAGEFERHPGLRTRRLEDVGLAVGRKRRRRRRQLRDLGRQGTGADRSGDLVEVVELCSGLEHLRGPEDRDAAPPGDVVAGGAIAGPAPWLAHHGTSHQGKHRGVTELLDGDRLKEELVGLAGSEVVRTAIGEGFGEPFAALDEHRSEIGHGCSFRTRRARNEQMFDSKK